jgi:hypothetical protein
MSTVASYRVSLYVSGVGLVQGTAQYVVVAADEDTAIRKAWKKARSERLAVCCMLTCEQLHDDD